MKQEHPTARKESPAFRRGEEVNNGIEQVDGREPAKPANVIEALAAVRRDLPGIGKNMEASPQQGGYSYRGIEDITAVAGPLFGRHGVVLVPEVLSETVEHLTVNNKPWTDTRLHVAYTVYGPGGVTDLIRIGPLLATGRDNSDKGSGKAMTQAFKAALLQVLCIGDSKDDVDGQTHEADQRPPESPKADATTHAALRMAIDALGPPAKAKLGAWWRESQLPQIAKADRLSEDQADLVLDYIESLEPPGTIWQRHGRLTSKHRARADQLADDAGLPQVGEAVEEDDIEAWARLLTAVEAEAHTEASS